VFATPHSKNPAKSSLPSYANDNFSYQRDNLYESFEIYKKEVHSSPGNAMFPGFFFA
jgi:hypothetical protein